MTEHSPWVEKYRPTEFKDIVLDATNKKILTNVIEKQYFPNLLFYGPPGTGKTTTIINLIKLYQTKYSSTRKGFMIHLNASDDRGIDIIRNQISQFVKTKSLFGTGMKFVILDEVDYMTKNAQQALRSLIQQYSTNVRFCLICNYISRIDTALQNEFVRLRFCQLPKEKIFNFLNEIQQKEELNILVSFGCAPENVDQLVKTVFAEMDTLKMNGPEAVNHGKAKETSIRDYETNFERNQYWLGKLKNTYYYGDKLKGLEELKGAINSVTAEDIQKMAKTYFTEDHYLKLVLMPEGTK